MLVNEVVSDSLLRLFMQPDGTLAQLVEQRTFNPFVVGSTPAGPTRIANPVNPVFTGFFVFKATLKL